MVLLVVRQRVGLSDDPARRAIYGISSGDACAFIPAWFAPEQFGDVSDDRFEVEGSQGERTNQ